MESIKQSRRQLLKMGSIAIVAAPMAGFTTSAFAKQNKGVRAALHFQDHPNGEKQCNRCMNFLPNKGKPTDPGHVHGCKLYPGDDEICPTCYCNGFVKKPS